VSAAGERRSPMARAFGGALLLLGVGGVVIAAVEIALFWPLEGLICPELSGQLIYD